ncbi:4Fe-4S dicluster domain-containing protein [Candidatus Manganitrophus noduliformans]|uniref:4Fe-4S dicluster domain-containing protein n=1 Tax=Candidatus Manganitrophus noduliformans TaxID=2606439 RepID=A0A7X6IDC5_9BACT|nr:4Fe-4S dicluster domain-containing protein [Candidatus Manganitrophus noduliformans]
MYSVADIDVDICGATKCRLCTQFCPESNTILYDSVRATAYVAVDRCKGCEICVGVCDDLAKHHAIKMVPITELKNGFEIRNVGFKDTLVTTK